MAKITKGNGPSDVNAGPESPAYMSDVEEESSPGNSSSPLNESESSTSEKPAPKFHRPAQTTESRSPKGKTESSSADSTAGSSTKK